MKQQRKANLLARIKSNLIFEPTEVLADGSYLAKMYPSPWDRKKDRNGIVVRIIEYTLTDPKRPQKQTRHRLLTTLLDATAHPAKKLIVLYHERWEHEGFFRTYKRTLGQLKLRFDTPQLVFREVEVALLGAQLLLCQGARAIPTAEGETTPGYSPRKVLQAFRQEVTRLAAPRLRQGFAAALKKARAERRTRTSAKEKRIWPRRKPHTAPKRPKIRKMTADQKALLSSLETGP